MEDFEFIEKEELLDDKPKDETVQSLEPCQAAKAVSNTDMPRDKEDVTAPIEVIQDAKPAHKSPPIEDVMGEDESLRAMEQELDDDLCVLNIHHLVLVGRIARQLGGHVQTWAHESWNAARESLHDGASEETVRSHGVSFAAAAVTLLVSLLLVHRQDQSIMLSSPTPNAMVSIARSGASCSPLAAAVLALAHNFTAVQNMQQALPPASSVLQSHAKDTKGHFELARSMFKRGASEKHVHGHRARAMQRKAVKELKKTSKWAARELHSLEALHRRFIHDAREAVRLERDAMEMVVDQLPTLVNALSEKDLYLLRRVLRSLSDIISRSEAALEAMRVSYKGAVKGVAYVASALDSHWDRVGSTLQSTIEGELASRKASLDALSLSSCLPSLEQQLEGELSAPVSEASCPGSPMDGLINRLESALSFQQRLLRLVPQKASIADLPGQHRAAVAACERSGGLAIALQRRHADLAAALTKRQQAATAA